jgi:triacylglycerol esterase/lipase EstA (alpha/beta hydrolase family)
MNFCLNQSGTSTDKYQDFKDWTDSSKIGAADFFTVNFNVDRSGNISSSTSFTNVLSNQASIVKQGLAINAAIKRVLSITGRDKVILVGHSMGGLASREYLQNSYLWQPDGNHHVAKLLTIGTPHGGSNSSDYGFTGLLTGLDMKSEAVRDLRTSYYYSNQPGVYLFGGLENYATMDDILFSSFYNVDVNCNGIDADGTSIVGLNQKNIPNNLNYSCIIGNGVITGDGVVFNANANLKNYYSTLSVDTFIVSALHTSLPSQTEVILKGLDESNEYNTAFGIDTGKTYFSNFTVQSKSPTNYTYDYDDYKISLGQNSLLKAKLYNIPTSKCYFNLLDSSQNIVYKDSTNGQGYYEFNKSVTKGKYFVEFYTLAEQDTWKYPYAFNISATTILPLEILEFSATRKDNFGLLNWLTANEINTDKFSIEKSYNSFDWITIGSLNTNNLSGTNSYSYSDSTTRSGVNYYRLKIMDKDGSFAYSPIKSIDFYNINAPFVIAPNPASSQATIFFKTQVAKAAINVYDVQGKLVLTQNAVNTNQAILKTDKLNSGTYMVNIIADGQVSNQQLVISK